eukprot:CAMPEP_0177772902 /NCGR_PEP_ID=MMETSP0491_2-20121128/12531_1 /TAXON_ID=63592 /ORGANISM="Tetraselmis chuii, Strain PLY429" /LENGTH=188 /DNA_ID=CAMNT_0019290865 /DNA_START=241 /DNA_END=807 /DNA_ORIENTATION=-
MGVCNSTAAAAPVRESVAAKRFDAKLSKVVVDYAKSKPGKPQTFMSLLLKFPKLQNGFDQCREIFAECDRDKDDHITMEEMKEGLYKVGFSPGDDALIADCFDSSDLDQNQSIEFKEFVVLLAVLFVLKKGQANGLDGVKPEITDTFKTILDCFVFFDANCDGILKKHEVLAGMKDPGEQGNKAADKR